MLTEPVVNNANLAFIGLNKSLISDMLSEREREKHAVKMFGTCQWYYLVSDVFKREILEFHFLTALIRQSMT